ncbi:hypothetical protein GOBAR_AA30771 [Gossypium barbadense]|uniref:Uncharacterized protein n=1 Tax=Gossypium barbadense TaxID=3634 RepID=A0A2P5WFP2_GOSBA|nr:hypothetical protein GOBAR_AA30771 [Gossypium barbadense]
MLTKFILVSETRFQNTEIALKNEQMLIKGLENQIGQLAKLILERPQDSLPSNIETNPREQLYAITLRDEEGTNHEERRLQIDELDEWRIHVKEKPRIQDEPKRLHDELKDGTNQVKVGDQVLLDKMDPRITTSELNANGATSFTILNIFPLSTIEANHSKFDTFKVNITRLKPYVDNRIDNEKEEFRLREPP